MMFILLCCLHGICMVMLIRTMLTAVYMTFVMAAAVAFVGRLAMAVMAMLMERTL